MKKLNLCGLWTLADGEGRRFPVSVPGTVLQALTECGEIADPFDALNEEAACSETRKEWVFERVFEVSAEQLAERNADLVFEGLDTLARIYVNGEEAASADNMHRTWRIPVRSMLRQGENTIRVAFSPAMDYVEQAARENPDVTYDGGSELRWTGALRKAHYMFGWDWGPRLPDAGIWRKTSIEFYHARLEEVRIHQEHLPGTVMLTVRALTAAEQVSLSLADPEGRVVAKDTVPAGEPCRIRVDRPRLWWPNGLGEQPLYTLLVTAHNGEETCDEKTFRIGLRTLTVNREKDEWGERFALQCNGTDFFAMGGDYIPEDNLPGRFSREKTARLLKDCRDCHFNTVRVWGGGVYPDDGFFDLCDEYGLVVWQDLMFACNTYKLTDTFEENIVREAEDNLRRIRHHASLGLICGNNEMETAWLSWGGVKEQPESLKQDYLRQFETVLKGVCLREAPDLFYWPSSPSSGGGFDDPNSLDRGDVHDWSVWHGRRPFSDFTLRYPRFCSEFGFESFPCMDTLRTFIHEEREMNPFSRTMESHQKCHSGNATMLYYLAQTLRYPFSMEKLIHATQWLQAEAIRAGVEHWRRNRGRCMGAIYWQINDCWPTASWAGIDSGGHWKALQYAARRFFAPTAVSLAPEGDGYGVFVANEQPQPFRGSVVCIVRDTRGGSLKKVTFAAECPPMGTVRAGGLPAKDRGEMPVVQALLQDGQGRILQETEALFTLPKYFPFSEPAVRAECAGELITVSADAFCMGVELQAGNTRFSDNWFCLYPGESRVIRADRAVKEDELRILWIE